MRLAHSLATVAAVSPDQVEALRRNIDPEWVVQAREATGTTTVRSRRLPAEQVVGWPSGWRCSLRRLRRVASPKRARRGPDPMEWLLTICAGHRAHASARSHHWRGLALYGIDGTTLRMPDSRDNAGFFGYSNSVRDRERLSDGARRRADGAAIALARRGGVRTECRREISYATNL